jgi:hypothetical protein
MNTCLALGKTQSKETFSRLAASGTCGISLTGLACVPTTLVAPGLLDGVPRLEGVSVGVVSLCPDVSVVI